MLFQSHNSVLGLAPFTSIKIPMCKMVEGIVEEYLMPCIPSIEVFWTAAEDVAPMFRCLVPVDRWRQYPWTVAKATAIRSVLRCIASSHARWTVVKEGASTVKYIFVHLSPRQITALEDFSIITFPDVAIFSIVLLLIGVPKGRGDEQHEEEGQEEVVIYA